MKLMRSFAVLVLVLIGSLFLLEQGIVVARPVFSLSAQVQPAASAGCARLTPHLQSDYWFFAIDEGSSCSWDR